MGTYLNSGNTLFLQARRSKIYIDKSGILTYLNSIMQTEQKYICVSRPRRFGKSMTANMISAFYDRTCDAGKDFEGLKILQEENWKQYANKYNVIHINMQMFLSSTHSVEGMLDLLKQSLLFDFEVDYPEVRYFNKKDLIRSMNDIWRQTGYAFVVIIDEWDCLFREFQSDTQAQKKYLDFLRLWMKDQPYIALGYMTGILPIKKYGTHSALNMFNEFSMENQGELAEYTGFTKEETEELCKEYKRSYEECAQWYDGYSFPLCAHIYNPKSVDEAMLSGIFDDYWNKTETYEALQKYIDMNYDGLKDAVIAMMAGERVKINTGSFQNDMTTFHNGDDVMTLLVHLGYLGYDFDTKQVFIPNKEVMQEFVTSTTVSGWSEVVNAVKESDDLLKATWNRDEEKTAEGIEKAHFETSHLQYNDENALSYTLSLAYYAAREYYTVIREMPSGKGFADLVFIPRKKHLDKPAMVVELKYDKDADTAIRQIQEKKYPLVLKEYKGNILLVGVNYEKKSKKHSCRIETA